MHPISVHRPASRWLQHGDGARWGTDYPWSSVTVEHLATHTLARAQADQNREPALSPGSIFEYSNVGHALLNYVVQKACGQTVDNTTDVYDSPQHATTIDLTAEIEVNPREGAGSSVVAKVEWLAPARGSTGWRTARIATAPLTRSGRISPTASPGHWRQDEESSFLFPVGTGEETVKVRTEE
ncbi:MAG: serine hydrolase [Gemmatimonadales bacterium]